MIRMTKWVMGKEKDMEKKREAMILRKQEKKMFCGEGCVCELRRKGNRWQEGQRRVRRGKEGCKNKREG